MSKHIFPFLLFLLLASVGLAQPSLKYDWVFKRCHGLYVLQDRYQKILSGTDNTAAELDSMAAGLQAHIQQHPEDKADCLFLLGDLYRRARPQNLRNPWKAMNFYEEGLQHIDPADSLTRSEACARLASINSMMIGYPSLYATLHYLSESTQLKPSMGMLMGDYFLFGWGVKQDLFMAATCYTLSLHFGSSVSSNPFYLLYVLEQDIDGTLDTVAYDYLEHAVYMMQIEKNWDSAAYWLNKAAQRDYAPACYELGEAMLNGIIPCHDRSCREEARYWIGKAVDKDYPPAIYHKAKYLNDIDLMQRAAELGHPQAMTELANYFLNRKRKAKYPHYIPDRAAYWSLMAAHFSDNGKRDQFDSIVRYERFSQQEIADLEQKVQVHYSLLRGNREKLISHIKQSRRFSQPAYRNTFFNRKKSLQRTEGVQEVKLSMVECYETIYNLYGHEVQRYLNQPDGYQRHNVAQFQQEMHFLRQRANQLMPNAFDASPLESIKP